MNHRNLASLHRQTARKMECAAGVGCDNEIGTQAFYALQKGRQQRIGLCKTGQKVMSGGATATGALKLLDDEAGHLRKQLERFVATRGGVVRGTGRVERNADIKRSQPGFEAFDLAN